MTNSSQDPRPDSRLDQITTRWSTLQDPLQFVRRYATAIRKYLEALLRNPHDAEEAAQEIMLHFVKQGFAKADPARGRFRDYLKRAVRNAAFKRQRKRPVQLGEEDVARLAVTDPAFVRAEQEWLAEWQRCLLNRAWRALEEQQQRSPRNLAHTVLRLTIEHPDEDSPELAERAGRESGRPLKVEAFRKQLSRARRLFAELVRGEVAQTLDDPTPEEIDEELAEIGLRKYLRRYLSD
jgi:RNA polymerase sigma-70 factor (ECF subfamily)